MPELKVNFEVPLLVDDDWLSGAAQNIGFTLNLIFIVIFLLAIFVSNALLSSQMLSLWAMLNTMQIYIHFVVMDLKMPAHARTFALSFIESVKLRILPSTYIVEKLFGMKADEDYLTENFREGGYDSPEFVRSASHYCIDVIIWLLVCIILVIAFNVKPCRRRATKITALKAVTQGSYRLLLAGSLEIFICFILQTGGTSSFSRGVSYISLVFVVILAIATPVVLLVYFSKMQNNKFKFAFGNLYEDFKNR